MDIKQIFCMYVDLNILIVLGSNLYLKKKKQNANLKLYWFYQYFLQIFIKNNEFFLWYFVEFYYLIVVLIILIRFKLNN